MSGFTINGPININDVAQAPDCPGLYVWYARLSLGKADWHADFAGGSKEASENLKASIRAHSSKHGSQNMKVEVTAQFTNRWCGLLEEASELRWGDFSAAGFNEICDQDKTRTALVELLQDCFPLFSSPLYIGLAADQTLRKRLIQHSKVFGNLWHSKGKIEDSIDPASFSARAFNAGFSPSELFCYAIAINSSTTSPLSDSQRRVLISTAEWLLNRWSLPTLGRK